MHHVLVLVVDCQPDSDFRTILGHQSAAIAGLATPAGCAGHTANGRANRGAARGIAIAERAQIRARTGRANLALTDFNSAIRLLPVSGLYHARGLFQELLGNLPEAASGYREALSRIPNSILLKKSLIRVEVDRKRFNQALDLIDEVLVRVSVKRSWYLLQGDVLTRMGKPEAARAAREKALAEVNQAMSQRLTAIHRFSRAKVYVALGRIDAAKQDLQLAIQMAPSFTESKDLLNQLEGS